MSMRIFRVHFDYLAKVTKSTLMVLNHLESLRSLMDVVDVGRNQFDATTERVDGFLKFLNQAVRKPNMVVDVWL